VAASGYWFSRPEDVPEEGANGAVLVQTNSQDIGMVKHPMDCALCPLLCKLGRGSLGWPPIAALFGRHALTVVLVAFVRGFTRRILVVRLHAAFRPWQRELIAVRWFVRRISTWTSPNDFESCEKPTD
jgi:hypothetical protein